MASFNLAICYSAVPVTVHKAQNDIPETQVEIPLDDDVAAALGKDPFELDALKLDIHPMMIKRWNSLMFK